MGQRQKHRYMRTLEKPSNRNWKTCSLACLYYSLQTIHLEKRKVKAWSRWGEGKGWLKWKCLKKNNKRPNNQSRSASRAVEKVHMIYISSTSTAVIRACIINHLPCNYISSVFPGILHAEGWGVQTALKPSAQRSTLSRGWRVFLSSAVMTKQDKNIWIYVWCLYRWRSSQMRQTWPFIFCGFGTWSL